jgi:hypothetical protein
MRKVSLGRAPVGPLEARIKWLENSAYLIERASYGSQFGELLALATDAESAAELLSAWRTVAASGVAVSHTGSTAEVILATVELPAGLIGANGILRVAALWTTTNDADDKTLRVNLGATAFLARVATTQVSQRTVTIIQNRNAQDSQIGHSDSANNPFQGTTDAVTTGTEDTSGALNLTITGQLEDGTDTVTLEAYIVELLKKG